MPVPQSPRRVRPSNRPSVLSSYPYRQFEVPSLTMVMISQRYHLESHPANLLEEIPAAGWYLLRVISNEEKQAIHRLKRLGGVDYLMIWTTTTRHYTRYRKRENTRPFLPGHLFIRSEQHDRGRLFDALRPVIELTPLIPSASFAQELVRFCRLIMAAGATAQQRPGYARGEWVEVIAGSLAGCRGQVIQHRGSWELVVGLSVLGTTVATRVDLTCVRRLEDPAQPTPGTPC